MTRIGSNTTTMKEWSNTVSTLADEFKTDYTKLYQTIETLTSTDYKGGVSEAFNQNVIALKPFFETEYEKLMSFVETINTRANTIDGNQESLAEKANSMDVG